MTRLHLIADETYWTKRAAMKRDAWANTDSHVRIRCEFCGKSHNRAANMAACALRGLA